MSRKRGSVSVVFVVVASVVVSVVVAIAVVVAWDSGCVVVAVVVVVSEGGCVDATISSAFGVASNALTVVDS